MAADWSHGDFGGRLRAARERRGVSLRQIAAATKISVGALEALERNDVSRLPGGIFTRAFVRSYAAEVGLDPDEAIQDFLAQFPHDGGTAPAHAQPEPIEEEHAIENERRMATTILRLVAISLPVAAALVYFGTSGRTPPPPQPDPQAVEEPTRSQTPADQAPLSQPPQTQASSHAGTRQTPAASAPVVTPPPRQAASSVQTATRAAAPPPPSAVTATGSANPAAADSKSEEAQRLTIELSVTRPCWV